MITSVEVAEGSLMVTEYSWEHYIFYAVVEKGET